MNPSLSIPEDAVLTHLTEVGYTAPVILQIRYGVSMGRIQGILDILWKMGLILRPIKGLAISKEWLENHPNEKQQIERALGKILVI